MRTASVVVGNLAIKEKLLVELASLGFKALTFIADSSDVVITDSGEFGALGENLTDKVILVLLETPENGAAEFLSGADDVIINPYDVRELGLRLSLAMMRRGSFQAKPSENMLAIDGMVINFDSYEVTIDGMPLDLTFKEYELLKCLVSHRGRVYTRDQLLHIVWGYDYYGGTRTVDVHIRRLRAKLGQHESLIETVRNVGYRCKK